MRQQPPGNREAQRQQAFDQIEVGREMRRDRRINAAGNRQDRKHHVKQQDEQQAPHEIRNRECHRDNTVDQPLRSAMAKRRAQQRECSAKHQSNQRRQQHQFDRRGQPP